MSKRMGNVMLSVLSLLLGGMLYLFFRKQSVISLCLRRFVTLPEFHSVPSFFRHYFGDFLWGFSLSTGLIAIFPLSRKGDILCAGAACAVGILWESAQWLGVVSGTGDVCDIFMYALAGILAIVINCFKER